MSLHYFGRLFPGNGPAPGVRRFVVSVRSHGRGAIARESPSSLEGTVVPATFVVAIATAELSSIFAPVSAPADLILHAATVVLAITAAIFVIVGGLLAYAIVAFRRRADDDGSEPPQVYGSDRIELAWTVIP